MARATAAVEFILLLGIVVLVGAFVGSPQSRPPQTPSISATVARIQQGSPQWDESLVLPRQSDRIANYSIDVRLDPDRAVVSGTEVLEWKNTTGLPQTTFPFHLYHNAWKNNRSTYAKENGWNFYRGEMSPDDYGYTNVRRVTLLERTREVDITSTFTYIQPDDINAEDQTVFQVVSPRAVRPGEVMRMRIEFETKQPAPISRTGKIRTYHFFAQWFPKIGVWSNGAWNCHQFHANTEFFADYGVYDVRITLPSDYLIGATGGIPKEVQRNDHGTTTHRFVQADVHDFAWLASPELVIEKRTFSHAVPEAGEHPDRHHALRDVTVILVLQPHHTPLAERYFDATFKALRYYGEWYGEYPYDCVTVVDPANGSRSGGMEYPTLFTGGASLFASKRSPSPESVTVHEFGHQFWYGLIGNNEFEEAWLDEGFNTYSQDRVLLRGWDDGSAISTWRATRSFFGGPGASSYVGIPHAFEEVPVIRMATGNLELRRWGNYDVMARRGWDYYQTYGTNSYTKPAMSLHTLERYLGEETMYRVMRTYHHRFRFKHPTSRDFISVVNEMSGKDLTWFFDNTWFSSDLFDYKVEAITNTRMPEPAGRFDWNGRDSLSPVPSEGKFVSEVVIKRDGGAIAPVDVRVIFEDGKELRESWDGKYRWKKFMYTGNASVRSAEVDPDKKLLMDVNWNNNSKVVGVSEPSLAARKYGAKFLFWVQSYFDLASYWQ